MILISGDVVLSELTGYGPNHPLVGYHNIVAPSNISADSEAGHPASLLAYPTTYNYWRSDNDDAQAITIDASGAYDYIGIARHNFGTAGISVQVEALDGTDYVPISDDFMPGSDDPIMVVFERESRPGYRIALGAGSEPPRAAVVYLGRVLALPSRIYVGHTPAKFGRRENITTGTSDSGEYLGRVFINEYRESQIVQQNINPFFYRNHVDSWVRSREPFFFAWRPSSYPQEVGYVWRQGAADMQNQRANGMVSFSMSVRGVR